MTRDQNRRKPLCVESLEDRTCLNAAVNFSAGDHTLRIVGDKADDVVSIVQNDSTDTLTVTVGMNPAIPSQRPRTFNFQSSAIDRVIVNLGAGNDDFSYQLVSDAMIYQKRLLVDLGAGDDHARFDFGGPLQASSTEGSSDVNDSNHSASDITPPTDPSEGAGLNVTTPQTILAALREIRTALKINVKGGAGNDQVEANIGSVGLQSSLNWVADLGSGDDSSSVVISGQIDGIVNGSRTSSGRVTIVQRGGSGNDQLNVEAGDLSVVVGAKLDVSQSGGQGDDNMSFHYTGMANGLVRGRSFGGDGQDTIAQRIYWNDGSQGSLVSNVNGNQGDDQLTNIIQPTNSLDTGLPHALSATGPTSISGKMDGGDGMDSGVISSNVVISNVEAIGLL